jgi:hypothetical protein
VKLKGAGVVVADALHHQLIRGHRLITRITGFSVGDTAQHLGAFVAGQLTAGEAITDEAPELA